MSNMFCSFYLDGLSDEQQVAIQQLFHGVLLPEFVQDSMQHPCLVNIKFFLKCFIKVLVVQPYNTVTDWKKFHFIL